MSGYLRKVNKHVRDGLFIIVDLDFRSARGGGSA